MGSWNETCGISKMRIMSGEAVRILPIVMNPFHVEKVVGLPAEFGSPHLFAGKSGCYIGDLWTPLCYPIRGEYDDYGSIDKIPDKTAKDRAELQQFLDAFKKYCLPISVGNNQCHDVSVKEFTLSEVLSALHEGRCFMNYHTSLPQYEDRLVPISWMMVKESVWQSLLATDVKKSKEVWGYKDDKFDHYSLEGIRQDITGKINLLKKQHLADQIDPKTVSLEKLKELLDLVKEMNESFGGIMGYKFRFWSQSPLSCPPLNEHLIDVITECEYMHTMLSILRINYAPTTGSGSQCDNYRLWKLVYKSWNKIIADDMKQNREMYYGE